MLQRPVFAAIALTIAMSAPAQALPGQSVETVVRWAKNYKVLAPLTRNLGNPSGQSYYTAQAKAATSPFVFAMSPAQNRLHHHRISRT